MSRTTLENENENGAEHGRLLDTLERLLAIEAIDVNAALDQASQMVAETLGADKVDALLHDPATETLVAVGTSQTPMGRQEVAIGMDHLPLASGGREVEVFLTGHSHCGGQAERDPGQLRGLTQGLGVRSSMIVALDVGGERRGVFMAASIRPNFFGEEDLRFLTAVAHWVGMIAHRAELVERVAAEAREQGRRVAADELVTTLAHDLGNRLTPLKTRIDMLRRRVRRENGDRDLQDINEAARAVERFSHLINDLLDAGRLEQGLFVANVHSVDLAELARETARVFETPRTRIQVNAPEELVISADPDRIRQALENLLSNAAKHSPAGEEIVVEVRTETGDDDEVSVVTVADQGPGIPSDLMPRLFSRFARAPGSTGLGLGLYIASRIAAIHGGTLSVDTSATRGACFRLVLPIGTGPVRGDADELPSIAATDSARQATAPLG